MTILNIFVKMFNNGVYRGYDVKEVAFNNSKSENSVLWQLFRLENLYSLTKTDPKLSCPEFCQAPFAAELIE